MIASVDSKRCQGHTLCSMVAPHSFALSDIDGTASPLHGLVPPEHQNDVREAMHSCPEQAISIQQPTNPTASGAKT